MIGRDALAGFIGTYTLHADTQLLCGRFLGDTGIPSSYFIDIPVFLRHGNSLLFGVVLLSRGAARGLPAIQRVDGAAEEVGQQGKLGCSG